MADRNPLQLLGEHGQSVWLDFISRELVTTDQLTTLVAESNVTGLTSNPTIFEKALAHGSDYDQNLGELLGQGITDPEELFLAIAISDIQHAADVIKPVFERTRGGDGFVSLEVTPRVAHDTEATVEMARSIWQRVDRPNLMVKVPATPEGIPAIRRLIGEGININVTLIFALSAHEQVIDAYIGGLEERRRNGQSLDVHSVASFFVSRVDTEVDRLLEERGGPEELQGKAAIANAQLAYELFEKSFRGEGRFAALGEGAWVQRPLWASTSAKNPKYRDVVYAEALIGPDTVDTMPPATIDAFRDHGIVETDTVNADYAGAHHAWDQLAEAGIDMGEVTERLLAAGVGSFSASFDQLVRVIAEKVDVIRGGLGSTRQHDDLGTHNATVTSATTADSATQLVHRIWDRDPDVWKPGDADHAAVIRNRLGWLDVIDTMDKNLPTLLELAASARTSEIRNVVLLGMGGSSLCPEVLRSTFGSAAGAPTLHVLDTTDPAAIHAIGAAIDPRTTWFLVASKSGGTVETLSHMAHFWARTVAAGVVNPGDHFIAITDPGTSLAEHARANRFRHIFENPPDIGGRYSALSYFGMVPAALIGIDVERFLDRARAMRAACGRDVPTDLNPGLRLGTAFGLLGTTGRDKITILASPRMAAFSLWAEQLIAESTGKEQKGLIPVGAEPIGEPSVYGNDRLFVVLSVDGHGEVDFDSRVGAIRTAGLPVISLHLEDLYDLAGEFFRWEFAVAVAAHRLQIDPFDEPNVKESKDNTARLLHVYESDGALPQTEPATVKDSVISVIGGPTDAGSVEDAFSVHLATAAEADYIALQAYVTPTDENLHALQALRSAIRDHYRRATTLGFGPRFLHSTGQLHKGGPNTGVFVQIVSRDTIDADIPGSRYSFGTLKQAQTLGDLQSLRDHHRRVIRLEVNDNLTRVLAQLTDSIHRPAGAAR